MPLFSKWCIVYFGNDMNEYFRIINVLQNENIEFKTKVDDFGGRMSREVIAGGSPLGLNRSGVSNLSNYAIMVKKLDEYKARQMIRE